MIYTLHAARNMLMHTHKHKNNKSAAPQNQTYKDVCKHQRLNNFLFKSYMHTHTSLPETPAMVAPLFFFLAKNYMSFNVITGLTRTDTLCLLLCAGPP